MTPENRVVFAVALAAVLLLAFACDSGETKTVYVERDDDTDDDAGDDLVDDDADDDGDDDSGGNAHPPLPDGFSGATPGLTIVQLTEEHDGWRQAECTACHGDPHEAGFRSPVCATCHGRNGAAGRWMDHDTDGCANCHSAWHVGSGFRSPEDCVICHKFLTFPECMKTEAVDAVVIGAGGGGLAAAVTLAQRGLQTVLIEKHYKVGGYMGRFERRGYRFEQSLHGFDGLDADHQGMNIELLRRLGVWDRVQPVRGESIIRLRYPRFTYDVPAQVETYRAELKAMYPDEAEGIDRLFQEMYELDTVFKAMFRMEYEGETPELLAILAAHAGAVARMADYMSMTLDEFLDGFIHDARLRTVWTSLAMLSGAPPDQVAAMFFNVMWMGYHIGGWWNFEGGSAALADALADVFVENGGVLRLDTLVTQLETEANRVVQVRTRDDVCYRPQIVIANANVLSLVDELAPDAPWPDDYVDDIHGMTVGLSAVQVWLGVDTDLSPLFDGVAEISVSTTWDAAEGFSYATEGVPEKVNMAIVNSSMLDRTAAPAGKNVITITTQLPWEWRNRWGLPTSYAEYLRLRRELAEILVTRADEVVPGLRDHIEVMDVGTPHTMQGFTLNPRGSIFGWHTTPDQSLFERLPVETPLENLYLAGAWTFPGGGQSAVLHSGYTAAQTALGLLP